MRPGVVYAGGSFSSANGTGRARLAAFDTAGGLLPWNPSADSRVNAMVATPDGARVVVAGAFTHLGGVAAYGMAAVHPATGALLPWAAALRVRNAGDAASILSLRTDGTHVYGSGYTYGGGGNLEGAFSATQDGTLRWVEDCHGDTYDVFPGPTAVYVAGHPHECANIGAFPETTPRTHHRMLAFGRDPSGRTALKEQGTYQNWEGTPVPALLPWYPEPEAGTFTGQSQAAWSVSGNADYVVMGGEFPKVNNRAQQGLVRFALPHLAPNRFGARVSGTALNPVLSSFDAGRVRVAWTADWDTDNEQAHLPGGPGRRHDGLHADPPVDVLVPAPDGVHGRRADAGVDAHVPADRHRPLGQRGHQRHGERHRERQRHRRGVLARGARRRRRRLLAAGGGQRRHRLRLGRRPRPVARVGRHPRCGRRARRHRPGLDLRRHLERPRRADRGGHRAVRVLRRGLGAHHVRDRRGGAGVEHGVVRHRVEARPRRVPDRRRPRRLLGERRHPADDHQPDRGRRRAVAPRRREPGARRHAAARRRRARREQPGGHPGDLGLGLLAGGRRHGERAAERAVQRVVPRVARRGRRLRPGAARRDRAAAPAGSPPATPPRPRPRRRRACWPPTSSSAPSRPGSAAPTPGAAGPSSARGRASASAAGGWCSGSRVRRSRPPCRPSPAPRSTPSSTRRSTGPRPGAAPRCRWSDAGSGAPTTAPGCAGAPTARSP
nr:hypothetical protein [Angustibacter aerolatus]